MDVVSIKTLANIPASTSSSFDRSLVESIATLGKGRQSSGDAIIPSALNASKRRYSRENRKYRDIFRNTCPQSSGYCCLKTVTNGYESTNLLITVSSTPKGTSK